MNTACPICKNVDCDDDCEELHLIYREAQRKKLRDIELDLCDHCGRDDCICGDTEFC